MTGQTYATVLVIEAALLLTRALSRAEELPSFGSQDELEVKAAVGRDAVFRCTVNNIMHYQTAWLEMKKGIVFAMGDDVFTENPRITVHHSLTLDGEEAWILTIKNVNMKDAGTYMCSLNTGTSLRKYYRLVVVVPPRIIDTNTSGDTEVREDETARLVCGASGTPHPAYKWRREDSSLIDVSGTTNLLVVGSELVFEPAKRHHAGAYLCIASNGVPPSVSKRILLSVRFEPQIRAFEPRVWVNLGSSVNLSCVVDGFPEPELEWLKDSGQPVTSQPYVYHLPDRLLQVQKYEKSAQYINASRRIMFLTVNDLREGDLMGYRCRANNSEGASEARVVLFEIPTTTTTTTSTTTTTTTTTSTSTTPASTTPPSTITTAAAAAAGTINAREDSSAWYPGIGKNRSAITGQLAEGQYSGQHKQQQQQEMDEQWQKQYERKTYTYISAGSASSVTSLRCPASLLLLFLLLLQSFLLRLLRDNSCEEAHGLGR